jgi:hypothetical protein
MTIACPPSMAAAGAIEPSNPMVGTSMSHCPLGIETHCLGKTAFAATCTLMIWMIGQRDRMILPLPVPFWIVSR